MNVLKTTMKTLKSVIFIVCQLYQRCYEINLCIIYVMKSSDMRPGGCVQWMTAFFLICSFLFINSLFLVHSWIFSVVAKSRGFRPPSTPCLRLRS